MSVKVLSVDVSQPSEEALAQGAQALLQDTVLVVPTDSVYGLVCRATPDNPAHYKIFAFKQRDRTQTLPLFIADSAELERYAAALSPEVRDLAKRFWPGALTLVVEASGQIDTQYTQYDPERNIHTVALRVPACPLVQELCRRVGVPLAQTSANLHGKPAARSAEELDEVLLREVDLVFDGGSCPLGLSSTIIDTTHTPYRVLRQGSVHLPL